MGLYFQKSLKRATAIALIFAFSTPVFATHVTCMMKQHINEDESFEYIATGRMDLSIRQIGMPYGHRDDNNAQRTETIRYLPAVEVAKEDIQQVKRSVVASDLLSYPQSYGNHKTAFQNLIAQAYRNTQLSRCDGNPLEEISVNLFKVSQKHLSRSKDRLEWVPDETLGAFFTFTNNKDQKVSILIKDLNAVLPLYMEHRRSSLDSLAPDGVELTADQRITGQFINRILSGEIPGNPLKRGIKFRLQNQTGLTLDELVNRFTGNNIPRPLVQPQNGNNQIVQVYHGNGQNNDYSRYFYSVLPTIGESFRIYNRSQMTDDEILACLFNVRSDQLPQRKVAIYKFRALKESGRPYASLFRPSLTPYEAYFESFLPDLKKGFRKYNSGDPEALALDTNSILRVLSLNPDSNDLFMSRTDAIKFFKSRSDPLSRSYREYAIGFKPPYTSILIDPNDRYLNAFETFMPDLTEQFFQYNKSQYEVRPLDVEVMSILFPNLQAGLFPSRETALQRFGELANGRRPYAQSFMQLGI